MIQPPGRAGSPGAESTGTAKSPERRKQESMELLESLGIKSLESLPIREGGGEVTLRTKEEVVERAIALLLIALYSEGACSGEDREGNRAWIEEIIQMYDASDPFSPKEKAYLENPYPSEQENIHFSWQYEPLAVLLWALGLMEREEALGIPAGICDVAKVVGALKPYPSFNEMYDIANLRGKEEILDQADLIFRYNWACVQDRIDNPMQHKPEWGVAMERHRALNWLINYGYDAPQDWDDVSTDT
jgi:hypothetical protein